jgi:hypothetical protein
MTLNPATSLPLSLALIGFGEAGETFASAAGGARATTSTPGPAI